MKCRVLHRELGFDIHMCWNFVSVRNISEHMTCIPYLTNIYPIIHHPSSIISLHKHPQVNPVTHAVGNTIKRVVIIVASVVAFKTPMSTGSIIGSSVAIAGTLMYSLAMNASKTKKD